MGVQLEMTPTNEERGTLRSLRPTTAQVLAVRGRTVPAAADGETSTDIAAAVGCKAATVGKCQDRPG